MFIVSDIQDAMMMRKKLMSIVRRSHRFGHSRATVLIELLDIIEDLDKNIERIDAQLDIEIEKIIEKHNNVEQAA